ncbi:immunoglobulin-like domain-containing protein [Candidatus Pristimantibacillus sp. PTI5]|uniref:immunoglobulin-like domain-containing protein n=1 Tax=Candidatus Pristimantibacillus sp. PTI5 TaxID=3400422 RepID=UPI003B026A05
MQGNSKSDEEMVQLDQIALTVYNIDNVRGNWTLPVKGENGTTIIWQSGSPEVITASGEVTRPKPGSGNESVKLTATLSRNGVTAEKVFQAMVPANPAKEEFASYLFLFVDEFGSRGYLPLETSDQLHVKK